MKYLIVIDQNLENVSKRNGEALVQSSQRYNGTTGNGCGCGCGCLTTTWSGGLDSPWGSLWWWRPSGTPSTGRACLRCGFAYGSAAPSWTRSSCGTLRTGAYWRAAGAPTGAAGEGAGAGVGPGSGPALLGEARLQCTHRRFSQQPVLLAEDTPRKRLAGWRVNEALDDD